MQQLQDHCADHYTKTPSLFWLCGVPLIPWWQEIFEELQRNSVKIFRNYVGTVQSV